MKKILFGLILCAANQVRAQVDTITTKNLKLESPKTNLLKHSYAVFFTDTLGNRTFTADIWDREVSIIKENGASIYNFTWKWYSKDSLVLKADGRCKFPSLEPQEYIFSNKKKQKRIVRYEENVAMIEGKSRKTQRDTIYKVSVNLPAFAFPMDMEILPMLPFKKVGQKFAIPFYEPGAPSSAYYLCEVTGKEELKLTEEAKVKCWLLKLVYSKNAYAVFWISESSREVIKMKNPFKGGYRYKVKLF
jgi:hypothetical protein